MRWGHFLPFVVLTGCNCGDSGPDPSNSSTSIFASGSGPDLSTCNIDTPSFATGSAASAQILFGRPCHGFFGFRDTCGPLTGVAATSSSPSWSVDKVTSGSTTEMNVDLTATTAGDASLTVAANGLSFGPIALHSEDPAAVTLGRYVRSRDLQPLDGLALAEGGAFDLGTTLQDKDGQPLCGHPPLMDNGSIGTLLQPDPMTNQLGQANSTVRVQGTAPADAGAATVRIAIGPAHAEATLDVVPLSAIDAVSASLTLPDEVVRLNVSAGGKEVMGATVLIESLNPSITFAAPNGQATSIETTEPSVDLFDVFFQDGGTPHGDIRVTVQGASVGPTTIKLR